MDIKNGEEASTGSTSDTAINITDVDKGLGNSVEHQIRVLTGSVQFGRGAIGEDQYAFTSDFGTFIMTMPVGELHAKQASDSDTFVVVI